MTVSLSSYFFSVSQTSSWCWERESPANESGEASGSREGQLGERLCLQPPCALGRLRPRRAALRARPGAGQEVKDHPPHKPGTWRSPVLHPVMCVTLPCKLHLRRLRKISQLLNVGAQPKPEALILKIKVFKHHITVTINKLQTYFSKQLVPFCAMESH